MDTATQWAIAGLVFLLILLIVLLFSKTPFLTFFTADQGWEKLDENSGILEHSNTLSRIPVHYQTPYDKSANLCYSSPLDGFIKMNYGIQDEKETRQYLVPSEDIECQLVVEPASPEVHLTPVTPERRISDDQLQCPTQLRRGISTDSLDSSASSIMEMNRDVPTANLTLKYDETTQMLSVQLHHLSDVYNDYGQIWMLFFLLPHPKPLWRTESPSDDTTGTVKLGEILFLASYSHDRLNVIVSKIRNLSNVYKSEFYYK
ncbi:unnamed protein product [Haemonchus placei]|uniref:TMEM132D_N domain-containing protein n=1 Tax=Haemonchus placei TaxID=6290 RepID=A0A0N4WS79_HAEPC|nr:unnamed protein product [Haemonchus placei]